MSLREPMEVIWEKASRSLSRSESCWVVVVAMVAVVCCVALGIGLGIGSEK